MKNYTIFFISAAEDDLYDIFRHVAAYVSTEKAEETINGLEERCQSLVFLADRGHYPPELERIGVYEYKEIHYEKYRIIYRIINNDVYIYTIIDGRRDLASVLERKILRP